jgi:HK97 family phage prohead protease
VRQGNATKLVGYASVFNVESEDLGGFTEQIAPGAFRNVLAGNPDVRCLLNHDPNMLLGRTLNGTLVLREDANGLYYECTVPDTSAGRDVLTLAERGDISQSSFGFRIADEEWSMDGTKRIIRSVSALYDVSPVTYPAYPTASAQARAAFLFPEGAPQRTSATLEDERSAGLLFVAKELTNIEIERARAARL